MLSKKDKDWVDEGYTDGTLYANEYYLERDKIQSGLFTLLLLGNESSIIEKHMCKKLLLYLEEFPECEGLWFTRDEHRWWFEK
jgi:hypothetical protein